ncbi:MAG: hypothetical protein GX066_03755 [Clostridiaceae bacterium]|nr:hypothetical protein [Clostridiaceae bacterium]
MKTRKVFILGTTAVLIFSLLAGNVAFADEIVPEKNEKITAVAGTVEYMPDKMVDESSVKIKKDKAVEIAKTMLEDPKNYELGSIYLSPKWPAGGSIWNIEFRVKKGSGGGFNVNVDGDSGKIVGFNRWDAYDDSRNYVAKFTRAEARKKAEEYLKKTLGVDIKNYELQDESPYASYYKTSGVREKLIYYFNFIEKINGIPFTNSSINIGVDGTDGKIMSYYLNSMDINKQKLPSPDKAITPEEALERCKKYTDMALQYIVWSKGQLYGMPKQSVKLAYVPLTSISTVDALTGESLNYDGSVMKELGISSTNTSEKITPLNPDAVISSKALTEEEIKAKAEKAKKTAEQILGVSFENNDGRNYTYYGGNNNVWDFNWHAMKENGEAYFSISINENTGHITSMGLGNSAYIMPMKEDGTPKEVVENISWEKGKEKAVTLLKQLLPEQYGFFADQNKQAPEYTEEIAKTVREHNYNFVRVVNGLPFIDNSINIGIDRETGDIRNMYFYWTDVDFPPIDNIIDRETAVKEYFRRVEPKLVYQLFMPYDQTSGDHDFTENIKLSYTFQMSGFTYSGLMFDAVTGKFIDWSGNEYAPEMVMDDSVLPDHWAKRSVELLIAQGILKGTNIKYDAPVTRAEAVKMVSLAKGMMYYGGYAGDAFPFKDVPLEDENYAYIENAIRNKLIYVTGDEFKGDEKITKEEFMKMLVNLMGYQDIAQKNEIFKTGNERNISNSARGYVAICRALGTLPVKDGGVLDGKAVLTYAEAAKALYNALPYVK